MTRRHVVCFCLSALLTPASCAGDHSEPSAETAQAPGSELSSDIASDINALPPADAPQMAAGDGALLVVGGIERGVDEETLRVADQARLIDMETGATAEIAAPRADVPFLVESATGGNEGFVVAGKHCSDGDQIPIDDWICEPGSGTAFQLRYGGREWVEVPFPVATVPADARESWSFHHRLVTTPRGETLAVVRSSAVGEVATPTQVLELRDGAWIHAATLPDERVVGACASEAALFVLTSATAAPPSGDGDPAGEGTSASASLALYELTAHGDAAVEVLAASLPAVDASLGGVAVALACDRSGPYLTSSTPEPGAPMLLFARRDGEWREIAGDWPPRIVERIESAPDGVAVTALAMTADSRATHTVAAGDADAKSLDSIYGQREFIADWTTGGFVTVGPIADYSLELEASTGERTSELQVTVDHIDP